MIASLSGTVSHVGLDHLVLDVGGVGMLVRTTPRVMGELRVGASATLATTLVVREDSLTLFGFADPGERDVFESVQTVAGVGPRIALAMLSVLTPDAIAAAVSTDDVATLTKVPGIGKKGAERLCLELRDKVPSTIGTGAGGAGEAASAPVVTTGWAGQVTDALVGLGYTTKQAESAVSAVADSLPADAPVGDALRTALRGLGS